MRRTPLMPSRVALQNVSRPMPFGLTAPRPVITTRRFKRSSNPLCVSIGMFPVAAANGAVLQQVLPMVHPRVQKVLAGIAAGALGGLALLGFLAVGSVARQDPWWRFSNLAGTVFFGAGALRSGLGLATLSGAAFEV